jgi:excisionase family DNA binding protein
MALKKTPRKRRAKSQSNRATFTPGELTRILGLSRTGVYAALRDGTIPNVRIGRRFVVPKAAVESWFAKIGQQGAKTEGSRH